jgi:hypothetical protein
MFLRER